MMYPQVLRASWDSARGVIFSEPTENGRRFLIFALQMSGISIGECRR